MKKILLILSFAQVLTSCASKIALSPEYWRKSSKVGILVNVNPPSRYKSGPQGLLDMALTSGKKYKEVLTVVENNIQPKDELINLYSEILQSKGKEFIILEDKFDAKTAIKFKGTKEKGKRYPVYDFSNLKSKYGIDELLFVDVKYGFLTSYYGMIELGTEAHASLNTNLINLSDNTLVMSNTNEKNENLKDWKKDNYKFSLQNIRTALDKAEEEEKKEILR
ncbi:TPA: hypothetical protein NEG48_003073 [Elizabethkingia anophelis]|nr:hypothetical protein [Elizabethkingia anophelis]